MNNQRTSDDRFERDLRAVLVELAPAAAPAQLHEAVASIPRDRGEQWRVGAWPRSRSLMTGLAAAAALLVAMVGLAIGLGAGSPSPLLLEYRVLPVDGREPTGGDVADVASIVTARLGAMGLDPPDVRVHRGSDRIVVEIPPADADQADVLRPMIGTVGRVDFVAMGSMYVGAGGSIHGTTIERACETLDATACVLFGGDLVVRDAAFTTEPASIRIDLAADAASRLASWSARHLDEVLAIALDGTVLADRLVNESMQRGGPLYITLDPRLGPPADSRSLVAILRSGPLPFPLQEVASGE